MNAAQICAVLEDLPSTFLRPDVQFQQWQDALQSGLARGVSATDAINNQVANIANAQFGWLDIWGLLFGIPRLTNEPDSHYLARIQYEVSAGGGTPCGIANWIYAVWGVTVTVVEAFPAVGYVIQFPNTLTAAQINTIVNSIARIRPAGVPFTISSGGSNSAGGPYLTTINFLNTPKITGAFVGGAGAGGGGSGNTLVLAASTNNAQPILPSLYISDPTLNS